MDTGSERLSPEARQVLTFAGWVEGWDRSSEVSSWSSALGPGFPLFPAARDALAKYGGISVRQSGAGEECARETFELAPLLAFGEEEIFRRVGSSLGTRLYPLGEAGGGHLFLAISNEGRVFAFMDDDIWLLGESMEEGLEALVRGRNPARVGG